MRRNSYCPCTDVPFDPAPHGEGKGRWFDLVTASVSTNTVEFLMELGTLRINLCASLMEKAAKVCLAPAWLTSPGGGMVLRRHSAVAHVFRKAGQEAGLHPQREKAVLRQPRPETARLDPAK